MGFPCTTEPVTTRTGRQGTFTGNLADPNDLGMSWSYEVAVTVGLTAPTISSGASTECNPPGGFSQGPYTVLRAVRSDGSRIYGRYSAAHQAFQGTYTSKSGVSIVKRTLTGLGSFTIAGFGDTSTEAHTEMWRKIREAGLT